MKRIEFRAPQKQKQMAMDIAKNRGVPDSVIYREALEEYLSGYSTIPSLKIVAQQVEKMQRKLNEIERTLLKKGILD
ncbi:unnamed protein product [marine sediment metagenome]|uniref:Ribbon-helix-helix protein CopG domain-containing protein n=1 Tax=marine sediment metagenome TaxID=412755 RepID=X0T0P1_9ZZZZ